MNASSFVNLMTPKVPLLLFYGRSNLNTKSDLQSGIIVGKIFHWCQDVTNSGIVRSTIHITLSDIVEFRFYENLADKMFWLFVEVLIWFYLRVILIIAR